jgi:putative colanic acid biosynthesis UDP-glucose lipid carrier transferase
MPLKPGLLSQTAGRASIRLLHDRLGGLADAYPLASLCKSLADPFILVTVMYVLARYCDVSLDGGLILLAILAFLMGILLLDNTYLLLEESRSRWMGAGSFALAWLTLALFFVIVCSAAGFSGYFPETFILGWLLICPLAILAVHYTFRCFIMHPSSGQSAIRRVLIIGANPSGQILAKCIRGNAQLRLDLIGFVDDRQTDRLSGVSQEDMLGGLATLARVIQRHEIHRIYISLPMAPQQRILDMLDLLKDSTVSVYFVPDLTICDLIQARLDQVDGLPVLGVCESPFMGLCGLIKRLEDIVLSFGILCLIWPILLLVALAVKLTSPGPVLFVQRRYGVDGKSIDVFKFRSMLVMEDGAEIHQAKRGDARLTSIGAFLRRTSLDELPQFFNVLTGTMSIVGPRPHANAHNELYRRLIKGYMIRHKVKPGITGWAQVNGWRGETANVEQMRHRIELDIDYICNWSVWLDVKIVLRTIVLVFRDQNAY